MRGTWGEGADGYGCFLRPGIAAADDEDHAVFEEALAEDFAAGDGAFDEAEVDLVRCEGGNDVFGVGALDGEADAGMDAEEFAEHAGEDVLGDGEGGADTELARDFSARGFEGSLGLFGKTRAFAGVGEEDGSCVGEADATFAAVEEGNA